MNAKALHGRKILSALLVLTLILGCVFCTAIPTQAYTQQEESSAAQSKGGDTFSWDNAAVYFLLTDRFYNGNTENDHSYGRGLDQNGNVVNGLDPSATFHGGDFAGITQKIEEGYFTDLGVNAIWLSAPYEQIHGYVVGGDGNPSFPHYAYHGYYAMDYTQTDANFGTAEEFQTLVDTAHENGIRIVMDIVLNHSGYNSMQDMDEYNFGTLKSGWESYYYSLKNVNNASYHSYIDYDTDATAWGRWWGDDWVRAGLAGYGGSGSGEERGCLAGLPDFKTESSKTVAVPDFLQQKWKEEGRYDTEMQKLNSHFSSSGKAKTVTNYLSFWISEWVRQYGVDGFRCDTAKHVEKESWANLKDQCVDALRQWKANNPDKALDDLDFWMTGEVWDHGVNKDEFYTKGKFDSIINFTTQGGGLIAKGKVGGIYDYYASAINNDPDFNVLSYISSHDTLIATGDKIHLGSAFLLLPGAVQIYYGDESDRPVMSNYQTNGDHETRGDMNWSSMNTATLEHWQTVGRFRNNHISVGGGANAALTATSGYGFSRTYNKNGISDKIAAVIDANTNTNVTLTVSSLWDDGQEVVNAYDGASATVANGKVTFNSGKNGTILIEEPDGKPIVALKGESSFVGTQEVTVTLKETDYAVASVDGGNKFKVYNNSTFTIGQTAYPGDTVKVTVTAQNDVGTSAKTFSFTKEDPNHIQPPVDHAIVHVQKPEGYNGTPLSLYLWQDNNGAVTTPLGGWPGKALTAGKLEDGWYTFELPEVQGNYSLIVNASGQPQSGDVTGLSGEVWIEVEATNASISASQVVADSEDNTPMGKLKREAREVKNLMAEEFTSATISPVLALVAQADGIIAKGENAAESEINQTLTQLQNAKKAMRLKAPNANTVKNGDRSVFGTAPCEAVVTVISGGKTYTTTADMFTGAWSVSVPSVTNADAVTVSCTKGNYASATVKANDGSTEPPIVYPTNPSIPTTPSVPTNPTTPVTPPAGQYILGDVDGNEKIELSDVLVIQNYMAAKRPLTDKELLAADVDLNSKADIVDVLEVQKYLAKMGTSCDVGKVINGGVQPTDPETSPTVTDPVVPPTDPATQPTRPENPDSKVVYLNNASNWNAPYAYFWAKTADKGPNEWPGVAMESVGAGTYKVTVPTNCDAIIFSNNGQSQTADLTIAANNQIFNNQTGLWSAYSGTTDPTQPGGDDGSHTIYVENNKGWSSVYAHYWADNDVPNTWPGKEMKKDSDGRYSLTIPKKYTNIVFSNNGQAQTDDLTIPGGNACFDLNSNSWS